MGKVVHDVKGIAENGKPVKLAQVVGYFKSGRARIQYNTIV